MEKKFQIIFVALVVMLFVGVFYVFSRPDSLPAGFNKQLAAEDIQPFSTYARGRVVSVDDEMIREFAGSRSLYQKLTVYLTSGPDRNSSTSLEQTVILNAGNGAQYRSGDELVLGKIETEGAEQYVVVDRYRLPGLAWVSLVFVVLALVLGRRKGLTALLGLGATGLVLVYFIAPQILAGKNPLLVSLVGSIGIVLITMFIAHGFRLRIKLAALSTLITLGLAAGVSVIAVKLTSLFGLGQADAFVLGTGFLGAIDLRGVLLGGIIISVLGVLDDVTTSQTAAVEELHLTDPEMSSAKLYARALSIGKEHIASLINTLILVYAGASLPLFLLIVSASDQPAWVLLNSEYMAEEIVRALVGSVALISAVPISSLLAAWYYRKFDPHSLLVKKENN